MTYFQFHKILPIVPELQTHKGLKSLEVFYTNKKTLQTIYCITLLYIQRFILNKSEIFCVK
jgi:hypothetical protein